MPLRPFATDTNNKRAVEDSKYNTGYNPEGVDYRDFNTILAETVYDHAIGTAAQVAANEATVYYNSANTEFRDKDETAVTFSAGDRLFWVGLDTLTADIDISTIDDLEHIMYQGITLAFGDYDLFLGDNQKGELNYTGTVTPKSGSIKLFESGKVYNDFETSNLIIDVDSSTESTVTADSITFKNVPSSPFTIFNVNETYTMPTDLMSGHTEQTDTWYQKWIDSERNILYVPDIIGTADANVLNSLSASGLTFQTFLIKPGDEIYQTTDKIKGYVKAVSSETLLTCVDKYGNDLDLFPLGTETFKIRILSPTGIGEFKAMVGAAYNDTSGHLIDSTYTQIQEPKSYFGDVAGDLDFSIDLSNGANTSSVPYAEIVVYQTNDWTGIGYWRGRFNFLVNATASIASYNLNLTGIIFGGSGNHAVTVVNNISHACIGVTSNGTATILVNDITGTSAPWRVFGDVPLQLKPSLHK